MRDEGARPRGRAGAAPLPALQGVPAVARRDGRERLRAGGRGARARARRPLGRGAPCLAVAPVLERLAVRQAGRIKVVKVNVDESPTLAARFGASSIPLLVVLRGGEVAERILGAQPLPALEARLSLHLA